jgi:hypothetical protein
MSCDFGTFCITTRAVVQVLVCKGWKLPNVPPIGAFSSEVGYRKSQMNEMCDIFNVLFVCVALDKKCIFILIFISLGINVELFHQCFT